MMAHAYAPSMAMAPEIYARYTQVTELHLEWDDVGGRPEPDEINLLVRCVNIAREAEGMKTRVQAKGTKR